MTDLHRGERHRIWFYPGPDDSQVGPYQARFLSQFGTSDTGWLDLTSGTDPDGKAGFYVWGATPDVPDAVTGDAILTPALAGSSRYRAQVRYTNGRLIDLDNLGPIDIN